MKMTKKVKALVIGIASAALVATTTILAYLGQPAYATTIAGIIEAAIVECVNAVPDKL
jgi:hypothetical protein